MYFQESNSAHDSASINPSALYYSGVEEPALMSINRWTEHSTCSGIQFCHEEEWHSGDWNDSEKANGGRLTLV